MPSEFMPVTRFMDRMTRKTYNSCYMLVEKGYGTYTLLSASVGSNVYIEFQSRADCQLAIDALAQIGIVNRETLMQYPRPYVLYVCRTALIL